MNKYIVIVLMVVSITELKAQSAGVKKDSALPRLEIRIGSPSNNPNQLASPEEIKRIQLMDSLHSDSSSFAMPDEIAHFPGGDNALSIFIRNHLKYPPMEMDEGIQGKVIIQFQVDTAGYLKQIMVSKSVSRGLDQEALKCVMNMPRWVPAKLNNKNVRTRFRLPINFTIQ